ncbi:MAG: ATP-binding protein [Candidatus Palauibacterales bacterium]|nr:ATP-binding protein [Candidatus Palauibacterales bacterium]MDP2529515.1 ATP-binding protein [Candidatus Palauibacterales bacterium]MDP2584145.1 ATP-binding protein [Candidatus Palauibacterales bacterium]
MSRLPTLSVPTGSLRGQLLAGLAVLLLAALLASMAVVLVWIPIGWSPGLMGAALLVLAFGEVAVLLLFGDYLLRHLFLEPLGRMVSEAERIAQGEQWHRIEVERPEELTRLAEAVNAMATRLIENQRMLAHNVRSLDETNRALTEARNELVQAEKLASVGRLAAGLAHEIGNPLNSVLAYTDVGRRRGAEGEWIEGIVHESNRIDRIVAGLLDYARPKSGPPALVQVNEIVAETVSLLSVQGRFREVDVTTELAPHLPDVRLNPDQLQQILVNLLLNACDAVEEGLGEAEEAHPDGSVGGGESGGDARAEAGSSGRTGSIRVTSSVVRHEGAAGEGLRARRKDDPEEVDYSHLRRFRSRPAEVPRPHFDEGQRLVEIAVADNGPGIPDAQLERVFDPFFTTKEPGRGTGLGLAVSARLAYRLGGTIEVSHRRGGGTVFTVLLPLAEDTRRPVPDPESREESP